MNTAQSIAHLIDDNTLDIDRVATHLDDLIADQMRRIDQNRRLSPVPLLWLAMALTAGLEVTIEGAVVAGPHAAHHIAREAGLTIETYAANASDTIGRIIDGPRNPPMTYSMRKHSSIVREPITSDLPCPAKAYPPYIPR